MIDLPFIDAHRQPTVADAAKTWNALVATLSRDLSNERFARLLGCAPATRGGDWSGDLGDATITGFAVTESRRPARIELRGSHHFSRYALVFVIDDASITAESYGEFPGWRGKAYRAMVIGSGAHRVIVRRLLRRIARRAATA
ncbi:MAG: hypothetical protein ACAI38_19585 [Myxococcota bacterium]|nr:hypothetical protein [Myxococcota bacterium]